MYDLLYDYNYLVNMRFLLSPLTHYLISETFNCIVPTVYLIIIRTCYPVHRESVHVQKVCVCLQGVWGKVSHNHIFVPLSESRKKCLHTTTNMESCFCRTVTHPAVTHEEVGRAAGENMRIVNYEGGSKREFSFSPVKMFQKESITLLAVKNSREAREGKTA